MGRRLGQHFLHDVTIAQRIVAAAGISPDDLVLEIGGGPGALTQHLTTLGARRLVVELDDGLADGLERRFGDTIEVIRGDVLEVKLAELGGDRRWVVLGNLPYYATSPILLWLADQWQCVSRAVVMIQREVAERIAATPGGKDWGRLSVAVTYRAAAELVLRVKPGSFHPPPNVDSAVLRLDFLDQPAVAVTDEARLFHLVELGFRHRRKTLATALVMGLSQPRAIVEGWLSEARLEPGLRAETLTLADWAALSNAASESAGWRQR